jgi:Phosphopantetheine attachment site
MSMRVKWYEPDGTRDCFSMRAESMPEISQAPVSDNTTKQLTQIWQEILGVDSITPDQNYFDLGADLSSPFSISRRSKRFLV